MKTKIFIEPSGCRVFLRTKYPKMLPSQWAIEAYCFADELDPEIISPVLWGEVQERDVTLLFRFAFGGLQLEQTHRRFVCHGKGKTPGFFLPLH